MFFSNIFYIFDKFRVRARETHVFFSDFVLSLFHSSILSPKNNAFFIFILSKLRNLLAN